MDYFQDDFELKLSRRISLWFCVFLLGLGFVSLLVQAAYAVISRGEVTPLFYLTAATFLFNLGIAFLAGAPILTDRLFLRYFPLAILLNFLLAVLATARGDRGYEVFSAAYALFANVFILLFSFFVRRQRFTLLFGAALLAGVFLLQIVDPVFAPHGSADIPALVILLFSILSVTVLALLNNHVGGLLANRARTAVERLQDLAFLDPATGLPNGQRLSQDLADLGAPGPAVEGSEGPNFLLAGFRLDGLEALNEAVGFEQTDRLVRDLSSGLASDLRALQSRESRFRPIPGLSTIYRVESNVFVVPALVEDEEIAVHELEALLDRDITRETSEGGGAAGLSFQGGYSILGRDADSPDRLLGNVLNLLHSRPAGGSGRFACFDPEHYKGYLRREALKSAMGPDLASGRFRLVFQPKVTVRDGILSGFEALARWDASGFGEVPPSEFIPLAEDCGLIGPLTERLLDRALAFAETCRTSGMRKGRVSLNLSPRLLGGPFFEVAAERIRSAGIGEWLEFEITEGILLHLEPSSSEAFSRIRELGVVFSIDDFGTGYSNISYLLDFEASVLKIDRRFILGLPEDQGNAKLVEAIIALGRSFSMSIVAEGVEERSQRDFLEDVGCDQIQGYYYSRPLEADAALAVAEGRRTIGP